VDLLALEHTSIGGNTVLLVTLDEKSNFGHIIAIRRKTSAVLIEALTVLDSFYKRFQHKIRRITPDAEPNLVATADALGHLGINLTPTIPGRYSRRVERWIRTLKERVRTILASLPYVWPSFLLAELYKYAANCINLVPSTQTLGYIPFQSFSGMRPDLQGLSIPIGRVAQFKMLKVSTDGQPNVSLGITLGHRPFTPGAVTGYLPGSHKVISRYVGNVRLTAFDEIPSEWGFVRRVASPSYIATPSHIALEDEPVESKSTIKPTQEPTMGPTQDVPPTAPTSNDMPTEVDVEPVSLKLLDDIAWMASFDEEDVEEEPYEASNYCAYVYVPETKSWRKVMDAEKERVSNVVYAYPITHAQALKGPHAEDADPAVKEELQNIDRNGVFNPVAYSSLSKVYSVCSR
jgi:hypothetical protein